MKITRSPGLHGQLLPALITAALAFAAIDGVAQTAVTQPSVALRRNADLNRRVVTGDFTGDGIVDLAANNGEEGPGRINLAVGRGDGTFSVRRTNALSDALGAGDFNGDGHLDLLTRWLPAPDEEISIWPGRGDGTFGAGVKIDSYHEEVAAVIADFDGDGNLDVAITSSDDPITAGVNVLLGNGDLTFSSVFVEIGEGRGLAAGDINGDGKPDIAVRLARSVALLINSGDGRLYRRSDLAFDRELAGVALGDLDADGHADLVVSGGTEGDGVVWVQRGRGDGTFEAPAAHDARGAGALTFGDLNRDGKLDVIGAGGRVLFHEDCAPGHKGVLWVSVLPGRGNGTLAPGSAFAVSSLSTATGVRGSLVSVDVADVNRDGHGDIIAGGGSVLLSRPPDPNWGPRVSAGPDATIEGGRIPLAASASDVDADALTYTWTHSGGIAVPSIPNPCVQVGSGTHTFTVTVDDGHGHTATDSVTYTVPGSTGPIALHLTAPADGEEVPAGIAYTVRWTSTADPADTFRVSAFNGTDWEVVCQAMPPDRSCVWDNAQPVMDNAQLTVIGVDRDDQVQGRATATFRIVAPPDPGSLPSGWSNVDVGDVGIAGSATAHESGEAFTVRGAGGDIWGTADAFHFAYQELPADGSIAATVAVTEGTHAWTKAGIMIRQSLEPGSAHHFLLASRDKGLAYQRRLTTGATSLHTTLGSGSSATFRIERQGNTLTFYMGNDSTPVGSASFPTGPAFVGFAVTSHDRSQLGAGTFAQVSLTGVAEDPPVVTVTHPDADTGVTAGEPVRIDWMTISESPIVRYDVFSAGFDLPLTPIAECTNLPGTVETCTWNSPGPAGPHEDKFVLVRATTASGVTGEDASSTFVIRDPGTGGGPLPEGWSNYDVGNVAAAGSTSYDSATRRFTISGSGADIWATADEFHFVSRTIAGGVEDGFEMTALIAAVQNVHRWTKVGLMIRAHRGASSPHAAILVTPTTEKGVAFQRRPVDGAASVHTAGPALTAPIRLRLAVAGGIVQAYYRVGAGDPWIFIGQDAWTHSGPFEAGLVVSSHVDGTLAQAVFDQVSVP